MKLIAEQISRVRADTKSGKSVQLAAGEQPTTTISLAQGNTKMQDVACRSPELGRSRLIELSALARASAETVRRYRAWVLGRKKQVKVLFHQAECTLS